MNNKFKCPICGNNDIHSIGYLHGMPYCRRCISFRGQSIEYKESRPEKARIYLNYELSKEQTALSDDLLENYKHGVNSLVFAVCGSGKTEIVLNTIAYVLSNGGKVGFAIPRVDVVIEIQKRLEDIFKDNKVIAVYGGNTEVLEGDIICLTTHQIFRYDRYFDLLILDEVDAFPYKGNETIEHLVLRSIRGVFIQMSATASLEQQDFYRNNGWSILTLNKRYHGHPLPVPKVITKSKPFMYLELYRQLKHFEERHKQVFVFVPTIDMSERIYMVFKHLIKKVKVVHSKKSDRKQIIEDFKQGKIQTLFTTSVLERGVTVKDLQVIVFNADSKIYDRAMLIQISGRVGRKKEAPEGEVIFIANKNTREIQECIKDIRKRNKSLSDML